MVDFFNASCTKVKFTLSLCCCLVAEIGYPEPSATDLSEFDGNRSNSVFPFLPLVFGAGILGGCITCVQCLIHLLASDSYKRYFCAFFTLAVGRLWVGPFISVCVWSQSVFV